MTGGLGNQMLQYALLFVLRKRGYKIQIDTSVYDFYQMHNGYELERVFGIKEKLINRKGLHLLWLRLLNKYRPSFLVSSDALHYDPKIIINPKMYIYGWWFCEKYFSDYTDEIYELFDFKGIDDRNKDVACEMRSCNSVCLHVRRGDYASFGIKLIGSDYYKEAIKVIQNNIENPIFYLFSDDTTQAEELLNSLGLKYITIDHNIGKNSYKDLYLMSNCKHNIIANSSFSWWGAWLNKNPNKIVVCPSIWDNNKPEFEPQLKEWIKI